MIDLNELAMFHQVARAGSFVEAARRLGIPPNTLSRRILQLEEQLGTRLMQRTTRKLTLTDAGRQLFERSVKPLDEALQAARQLSDISQEPSGGIRIAVTADFFDIVPMQWIAEFLDAYPKLRLDFVLSDERSDLIAEGIDLAFRAGDLKDSAFIARKLHPIDLVLAASPAYLRKRGKPAAFEDLARHDCITSGKPGRIVWRADGRNGPQTVTVTGRFGGNTVQSQVRAAQTGLGICFVPTSLVARCFQDGSLTAVLPTYRHATAGLYCLYPSKQVPRGVTAFLDMVLARTESQKR